MMTPGYFKIHLNLVESAEACLSSKVEDRLNNDLWFYAGGWISDYGKANQEAMWRGRRLERANYLIWC